MKDQHFSKERSSELQENLNVQETLSQLSLESWKRANWPVVSYVAKGTFAQMNLDRIPGKEDRAHRFWLEVFHPERFFSSKRDNGYVSDNHFLFVLHSFTNEQNLDSFFKAITTREDDLVKDPSIMINYDYHGRPCERRGGGSYPSCNFWAVYDNITDEKLLDTYMIPDTKWRERYIRENFF